MKVSINDLKLFQIPDTTHWRLNEKYLQQAKQALQIPTGQRLHILLNFKDLNRLSYLVLSKFDKGLAIVLPNWPGSLWFKPMAKQLQNKAFKFPNVPDLFVDKFGHPLGELSWENFFYVAQ